MFFNNKFNTFFGLNLTLVYTFPMCMAWRFHFPIRNYDFKGSGVVRKDASATADDDDDHTMYPSNKETTIVHNLTDPRNSQMEACCLNVTYVNDIQNTSRNLVT